MYNWYVAVNGQTVGPFSQEQLLAGIQSGQYNKATCSLVSGKATASGIKF
ncbi:MAG: DUF4339 domain-containing protein [Candidatus Electrothrix sp. MAN1_4]|nr:DUF4339 domain-containing protein [Candidatus Electrothrix sp. MAN1_4]